jgi:hypothetical protein
MQLPKGTWYPTRLIQWYMRLLDSGTLCAMAGTQRPHKHADRQVMHNHKRQQDNSPVPFTPLNTH